MKKLLVLFLGVSTLAFAAGKLQDADFKTELDLIAAGGNASLLLNDTKIYVTSVAKTLDDAIADGDIGGGGSVDTKGQLQGHDSTAAANVGPCADGEFIVYDDAEATGWKCSDQLQGVLNPVSDWSTPETVTDNWGNFSLEARYMRVGQDAIIEWEGTANGAVPTGVTLELGMPSGLIIDTSSMLNRHIGSGFTNPEGVGFKLSGLVPGGVSTYVHARRLATDTSDGTGTTNSGLKTASLSSNGIFAGGQVRTYASGNLVRLTMRLPIVGWSSGTDAVVRNKVLRKVRARKTSSQTITDNTQTTVIFDDELEDSANLYNNSTGVFTCPEAGAKFRAGYTVYYENIDDNSDSIVLNRIISSNGDTYEMYRKRGFIVSEFNTTSPSAPFDFECGSQGETWEFQAYCQNIDNTNCSTRANSGNNYYNNLSITELADSNVIAGTFGKCQTKFLSGNSVTAGVKSDLTFNNLKIGTNYRIRGMISQAGNSYINIFHNGVSIATNQSSTTGDQITPVITAMFTATATTTTLNQGNTNTLYGSGGYGSTWLELCTEPKEFTTEFN